MSDSTAVLRRLEGKSKRRLWQILAPPREETRTQFFGQDSSLARKQSHTQFLGSDEATERLLGELAKSQALQTDRIVIFLDRQKYVVPRSKLDEWERI